MNYRDLEIWQISREAVIEVHGITLTKLPKFEIFEEGSQIRKSSKTVKSTIVEGYGRRNYKQDFIKFLIFALSSNDESIDHLETLYETKSLQDENLYNNLKEKLDKLGRMLNNFIQSIEHQHLSKKK